MKIFTADYLAFGEQGEYTRPARTVGELPYQECLAALKQAAIILNVSHICYGVEIWATLKLKKADAMLDDRKWLMLRGEQLPLSIVNSIN